MMTALRPSSLRPAPIPQHLIGGRTPLPGRNCFAVTGTFRGSSSFVIGSLLTLNSRSGRSMLKKTILWDFFCVQKVKVASAMTTMMMAMNGSGPWELAQMFRFQSDGCSRAESFAESISECGFTRADRMAAEACSCHRCAAAS
jgi:hypothetical protein